MLAGLLDDGVVALLAPTALLELAPVLVSLVCGGVLVELGLVWSPDGVELGWAAVPVPAAGLFGFELLLVPAIGWSPVMFPEVEDAGLLVLAAEDGLDDVDGLDAAAAEVSPAALPIAPELLAPVEVQ